MTKISLTVDGMSCTDEVEPRTLLVHYLREQLGKVGTVVGCDTSNCGACTVELDGQSVKSCTVLAVQADGGTVLTVEGLAQDGSLSAVQQAFHDTESDQLAVLLGVGTVILERQNRDGVRRQFGRGRG